MSWGVIKHSFIHSFIHPTDRIAHTIVFATPVVEHWLEEIHHLPEVGVSLRSLPGIDRTRQLFQIHNKRAYRTVHTSTFLTPVVEHWLEEIHHMPEVGVSLRSLPGIDRTRQLFQIHNKRAYQHLSYTNCGALD